MICSRILRSGDRWPRLLLDGHFFRQEEVARELLRDGAGARQIAAAAEDVVEQRADNANRIDAGVVVEPSVFDGEHRFLHARRNGFERDAAALLARAGHERRDRAARRA